MTNSNLEKPLYSLTVGEYIELHKSLLNDLNKQLKVNTPELKEILTVQEAAVFLHLSVATLYTMNSRNQIPFTKVLGKVYYRQSELMNWLASGNRKSNAQLRNEILKGDDYE